MKILLLIIALVSTKQEPQPAHLQVLFKDRKNCNCTIDLNKQKFQITSDTLKLSMSKGRWNIKIDCDNGATFTIIINHFQDEQKLYNLVADVSSVNK